MGIVNLKHLKSSGSCCRRLLPPPIQPVADESLLKLGRNKVTVRRSQSNNLWVEREPDGPCLLVCANTNSPATRINAYAGYLSRLLGVSYINNQQLEQRSFNLDTPVNEAGRAYDLVIWEESRQCWLEKFLFGPAIYHVLECVPASLLVARQPRWPLRQILLIIRSEEAHGLAANWAENLARLSEAMVTILVVVPQVSPFHRPEARPHQLLAGDSLLERQLRYVSQRLEDVGVGNWLRVRQGFPEQQIQTELNAKPYDLVIIAVETKDWWLHRLIGESVKPVLRYATCPVLIAKPYEA